MYNEKAFEFFWNLYKQNFSKENEDIVRTIFWSGYERGYSDGLDREEN